MRKAKDRLIFKNKTVFITVSILIITGASGIGYLLGRDANQTGQVSLSRDFIRVGQKSFGLDVCTEMSRDTVAETVKSEVYSIEAISNGNNQGCEYFLDETRAGSITIMVAYSDMQGQKTMLKSSGYLTKEFDSIGLDNFATIDQNGLVSAIYLDIMPEVKYVALTLSDSNFISENDFINLAENLEKKIRSYTE